MLCLPQLRRVLVYRKILGRRRLSSLDGIVRGIEEELERSASINCCILGDPGEVSRVDKMAVVKVYCTIETSPWTLTLNEPVPEAFGLPASDWAEKFFSDQSAKRSSRVSLMFSYTTQFSSSIAVVAWPVQRKFSRCRKVQKSCNKHRDPFKNASLALYTIYNDVMSMKD